MNADAFRHLYGYHFGMNRYIWDEYIAPLSQDQFTQEAVYSHGSVRNQFLHLINCDALWFSELQNLDFPGDLDPQEFGDRAALLARWNATEQMMRGYLAGLRDDMLFDKPIREPEEDSELAVWQVLLHVVNHGTDHRAQILRLLNDMGIGTTSQDYIFYVYDQMG